MNMFKCFHCDYNYQLSTFAAATKTLEFMCVRWLIVNFITPFDTLPELNSCWTGLAYNKHERWLDGSKLDTSNVVYLSFLSWFWWRPGGPPHKPQQLNPRFVILTSAPDNCFNEKVKASWTLLFVLYLRRQALIPHHHHPLSRSRWEDVFPASNSRMRGREIIRQSTPLLTAWWRLTDWIEKLNEMCIFNLCIFGMCMM